MKRCYVCGEAVSEEEAREVVEKVEELDDPDGAYDEELMLVDCDDIEDDERIENGPVVCTKCFERGKAAVEASQE